MPKPDRGTFWSTGGLARFLGVHRNSVSVWCASGKLEAIRTFGGQYRIPATVVNAWLRGQRQSPTS